MPLRTFGTLPVILVREDITSPDSNYAKLYERFGDDDANSLRIWVELAKKFDNPKIIELGCGSGSIVVPLANLNFNVTAIDADERMLEIVKKRSISNINTYKLLIGDLNLKDRFDLVLITSLLLNTIKFNDVEDFIYKACSLVSDKGIISIEVASEDWYNESYVEMNIDTQIIDFESFDIQEKIWRGDIYYKFSDAVYAMKMNLRIFSESEITELFARFGFFPYHKPKKRYINSLIYTFKSSTK